jgi:hypothetical protein
MQLLQVFAETDKFCLIFSEFLNAERVAAGEDYLLLVKTLEVVRG